MIAIVLSEADDRILSALHLQTCKDFKVYLGDSDEETDASLEIRHGSWSQVEERFLCILEPGSLPDPQFVDRISRAVQRHPDYDVYHVNVADAPAFPRKASAKKFFKLAVVQQIPAPLSSFVFRSSELKNSAVLREDGSLDPLPTVFSCLRMRPLRNVWKGRLAWVAPALSQDPVAVEKAIRERLDLFRWTEDFFGDDDYPLSVSDQLHLFAREVVRLYPSFSEADLKEMMAGFQVSQGPVRKVRALSALKTELRERNRELQ